MEPRNYDTSQFGTEAFRYFSLNHHGLVCVLNEGISLLMAAFEPQWRKISQNKPELDLQTWLVNKKHLVSRLPEWQQNVRELPEIDQIEAWVYDSGCETVTGDDIEPDGYGADGAPSWLIAFGLI